MIKITWRKVIIYFRNMQIIINKKYKLIRFLEI